jgi:hypothetical protein
MVKIDQTLDYFIGDMFRYLTQSTILPVGFFLWSCGF